MSQEKIVDKSSNKKVIALALICVILAASLVGVIAVFQPNNLQSQIAEKDDTINSLTAQIEALQYQLSQNTNASTYVMQIAYLNQALSDMNDTLTSANAQIAALQNIAQLKASGLLYQQTLTQEPNATTTLWNDQLDYAGYVVVEAQATANTTYAQTLYTYAGANFDYNITIGTSGTAVFPVLPGVVEIRIGNIMQTDINNATVTVTYYY